MVTLMCIRGLERRFRRSFEVSKTTTERVRLSGGTLQVQLWCSS
jgi:hypothetical protein